MRKKAMNRKGGKVEFRGPVSMGGHLRANVCEISYTFGSKKQNWSIIYEISYTHGALHDFLQNVYEKSYRLSAPLA